MNSPSVPAIALLCLTAFAAPTTHALSIEPGLWRYDITTENAFTGAQQMQQEQCVTEPEFDPDTLRQGMGECADIAFDERADGLDWRFRCDMDGVEGKGEGEVTLTDGELTGGMRIVMSMAAMGGREFVIESSWRGRRVGACR
ncbi:MAG TPA: DUF3617 family protein [Pseudomonadales bacterium]|nr:DUF3617 family protein [Pseudomonadales bacterium]